MGYTFTALLERKDKLLPVTFGASSYEEAETMASAIAASLKASLKELSFMMGVRFITVEQMQGVAA